MKTINYELILASKSPRRHQFLKDLGLEFTVDLKEVEEVYPKHLKGAEITDYLAELKSKPFTELKQNQLLITSDTIVWMDDKAIGKPQNSQEAIKTLSALSGKQHEVITSICLKTTDKIKIVNDTTYVFFKELSLEEIKYYVDNFNPLDKAGAYGIQDWIGLIGAEKIIGSYFNVMGLPVHKLYAELLKF